MSDSLFMWILAAVLWYQVIAHLGISIGLHRYFSHRQFKVPTYLEYVILYLATIAGARSPIGWIAAHRMHHAYSDSAQDPHSPEHKGFFHVLFSIWSIPSIPAKFSRDLYRKKSIVFFHKNWKWIWLSSAVLALMIGIETFLAFIVAPAITSFLGFGIINSVCHVQGQVRNQPWLNILTAGEGYHLEHHQDGRKWQFHRFDLGGWLILLLAKARVVKL